MSELLEGNTFPEEPSDKQIADACMWYRHDFGLLHNDAKRVEMNVMRSHWRAIWKACNTPGCGGDYLPSNTDTWKYN